MNMREHPSRLSHLGKWALILSLVLTCGGAAWGAVRWALHRKHIDLEGVPTTSVRCTDLVSTLRADGWLASSQQTTIECEIEAVYFYTGGRYMNTTGASTVLTLVPEGTFVHEGDVLCQLDASDYEELVQDQEIKVQESRADFSAARLQHERAITALREYRDGLVYQKKEQLEGQITLARATIERAGSALAWARRMGELGYIPRNQVQASEQDLARAKIDFDLSSRMLNTFVTFSAPKATRALEAQIEGYLAYLSYQKLRANIDEERLANYKKQIERCTIRAPHDGFLVYANQNDPSLRIDLGVRVRQHQPLFILPDLTRMEVETHLNESVVDRVKEGHSAVVRVEAYPQMRIEGHVVSVNPLPMLPKNFRQSEDVKTYVATVKLDSVPVGLKPGMSAEVEVLTASRPKALVVPTSAIKVEDKREFCLVVGNDGVEKREVKVGEVTPALIEVKNGLKEGEQIVLEPSRVDPGNIIDAPSIVPQPEEVTTEVEAPPPSEVSISNPPPVTVARVGKFGF